MTKAGFTMVGLDIGSSGIRAVQLERKKPTKIQIARAAWVDLPDGVIQSGTLVDAPSLTRALKSLWRKGRFTTRKVAFALTDPNALTRQLDLPWMNPEDFRLALKYQVQELLPVDMNAVDLDYHLLNRTERIDAKGHVVIENRILIVAAQRAKTTVLANAVRAAGLEPLVIDHAQFALIRAACQGQLPTESTAHALVDIGAEQLSVTIHSQGQPRFIRTLGSVGGKSATAAIAATLDIDDELAEALKRKIGLNGVAPTLVPVAESSVFSTAVGNSTSEREPRESATLVALNSWATSLLSEITNSLDYYLSDQSVEPLTTVTILGRAAQLDGLHERIATQLPYPILDADPCMNLSCGPRIPEIPHDARLAVAIGLAMADRP